MGSHPRKDVDAQAKQESPVRARQLIREWCDEMYERMMAEMANEETITRPPDAKADKAKGGPETSDDRTQETCLVQKDASRSKP